MGNYCSTGLKKKDLDNTSNKSDESPSYQLNEKNKKNKNLKAAAPLADPEPISDVSAQNTLIGSPTGFDQDKKDDRFSQDILKSGGQDYPRANSVTTTHVPIAKQYPSHLVPLLGKLDASRPVAKDQKIVLYILSADSIPKINDKIKHIYSNLRNYCSSRDFELVLSNLHSSSADSSLYEEFRWTDGPLEAQSGHSLAANCTSEITRQTGKSYLIPILCLGNDLGEPLLPLTIESQDFLAALSTAERGNRDDKQLLEKWYSLDNKAQPPCYRLMPIQKDEANEARKDELRRLLEVLVNIFSNELKDLYLTTVVEQEINNTILISQELAKRCICIQSSADSSRVMQNALVEENARRATNLANDLKSHLVEKNVTKIADDEIPDQILGTIEAIVRSHVDVIIEEHLMKSQIPNCTHGVDKALYKELEAVNRHSLILSQSCPESKVFAQIKKYIIEPSSKPLIVYGKQGSGKTVLISKLAQNIHDWIPDCCFVLRYAGLTENSMTLSSILQSIVHQVTHIQSKPIKICHHDTKQYSDILCEVIKRSEIPIVITIDSIESCHSSVEWIPAELPDNVKLIFTLSTGDEQSECLLTGLKNMVQENLVCLTSFSNEQWNEIINSGGSDFCAANGALQLPAEWIDTPDKTPIHAKILWWLAWLGIRQVADTSTEHIANHIFHVLETRFTKDIASYLIALIAASRGGVKESDMVDLISSGLCTKDIGGSPVQLWLNFCWTMGPLLLHTKSTYFMDKLLLKLAKRRYENEIKTASKTLRDFYEAQPLTISSDPTHKHSCPNGFKLTLLPYYAFIVDPKSFSKSQFVTDLKWIYNVIDHCGCLSLLKDLDLAVEPEGHIQLLQTLIRSHYVALNYDARQFHTIFHTAITESSSSSNDVIGRWREEMRNCNLMCLEEILHAGEQQQVKEDDADVKYDSIVNLGGRGNFVISISTSNQELVVWDVVSCKKVRTLKGVAQPSALCPVGDHGVAVLCGREIKVLDLDDGCFKVTLKGVMNQKMPYFGLHDAKHLVCLSRNRMYVNLMNLESGDCVTTFKAGEDRFLNSLLVSGDGRILVCGDETQKPFPLLVWHLTQRKLLYDLRIPHHDFITSLSAITHEGSYVCVVAKELAEDSPNFIVVYDLQSGTLFKKWKPACNTVSLAISQAQTCVIAGLEDARILVWDLVTGNCKLKLLGHTAPVTLLKLDPTGKILLSGDKENQDISIRIWDLSSGSQLAVYTPPQRITTCEIMPGGRFIIVALETRRRLTTLELKPLNAKRLENVDTSVYGKAENEGKEFEIVAK